MLQCDLHDYVEIMCMFRYRVLVSLSSDNEVTGAALDTDTTKEKQEYLKVMLDDDSEIKINLNDIKHIKVLTANARFNEVTF